MTSVTHARRALLALTAFLLGATATTARDGDVFNLTPLSRLFDGLPHDVAYSDPIVVLALDTGIETIDVSNAAAPTVLDHLYLPSPAYAVVVRGPLAYVAAGEAGLIVVDLSDPANLVVRGQVPPTVPSGAEARGLALDGPLAYLAEGAVPFSTDYGLTIVDVSNPAVPTPLGRLPLDNGALAVAVAGGTAFVGIGSDLAGRHGVIAVDVSDPRNPRALASSFVDLGLPVRSLLLSGGTAYAGVGDRLAGAIAVLDMTSPSRPTVRQRVPLKDGVSDLSLVASTLLVAAGEQGVRAFATGPGGVAEITWLQLDQAAVAVCDRGDVAFVGVRSSNGRGGLVAVDRSAGRLTPLGRIWHSEATGVAAVPSGAFLLRRDGLHVFDTSVPTSPVWQASWNPPDADLSSLHVASGLAAVGEGRTVHLVDVVDPSSPVEVGSLTVATGVVVRVLRVGTQLYVVTSDGLEIFDVTSPSAPVPLAVYPTRSQAAGVAVDGNLAYLIAGDELLILDVSAPSAPMLVGDLILVGQQLRGVAAEGDLVVLTGLWSFLYVVDVAFPGAPILSATMTGRSGFDLRIIGDRVVVAADRDGVWVVDVSSTTNPIQEGYFDTAGRALAIANEGSLLYVATDDAQHWLMTCDTCTPRCSDTWPVVDPNSLKVVKKPVRDQFHWTTSSGSGSFNLHRTATKTALPSLYLDMGTSVATAGTTTSRESFLPGVREVAFYRVFGAAACTGVSRWP